METFFREHPRLVYSTLWLLFGILAAGYTLLYQPLVQATRALPAITAAMNKQNQAISDQLEQLKQDQTKISGTISRMPSFLKNINGLASENNVVINSLTPIQDARSLSYKMEITDVDYYTFLKFIEKLESLNVSLDEMHIHPFGFNAKKENIPTHHVSFVITPFNDAEPLSEAARKNLKEKVSQKGLRNPFQRFVSNLEKVEPFVDLTWVYQLGGFGSGSDGQPFAFINNFEYRKGMKLDDREIVAIDRVANRVLLEKDSEQGRIKFVLKVRKDQLKPK